MTVLHIATIYESLPMVQSYDTVVDDRNPICNVKKLLSTNKRKKETKIRYGSGCAMNVVIEACYSKRKKRKRNTAMNL